MQLDISVVVPMKNEAPNVDELYRELTAALEACGRPYEILAIDDGSTDDTFARLARLQASDSRLRVIQFRRNFGQTASFAAGFAHARGRYIVTMDGDLQNDPRDIAAMVTELEQRPADIIAGWRKNRKDKFFSRRLPSMVANRIISKATGVKLHDYGCSLKVFRAEVVKPMKLYGEMHRFLPAIASEFGVTTVESGREPPGEEARHLEVRHLAHDSGDPRSPDGQVPDQLPHAPGPDLRAVGSSHGTARQRDSRVAGLCAIYDHAGNRRPPDSAASASC